MKNLFDSRYRRAPIHRDGAAAAAEIRRIGGRYLDAMRAVPGRPNAMAYFDSIMAGDRRLEEVRAFRKAGGKVVGLFCNFVPEELIHALGALPLRLCAGAYPAIGPAEEVLARDTCPMVKSSLGLRMMSLSYISECDLVIVPTSCDAKKKGSRFLDQYVPTWTLDLPQVKDYEKNLTRWTLEIRGLKERLEAFTGRRLAKDALAGAIRLLHRRTDAFRRFHEVRKRNPGVIGGRDTFLAIQATFYDDPARWTAAFDALTTELEARPAPAAARPRILLTGAPIVWPNWKLLHTIEEAGAVVVADTLCSGTQRLFDPVEVDEWTSDGMLRALAVRHLFPSICPCFIENAEHIDRVLELAGDFKADGVIYHTLRLCQLFDLEYHHVGASLRDKGLPLLGITTDYSLEDEEQLKTRVEAFLEMIGERV
jgi:benzoyl-CoA reductase/2-hydroxyglutaryl-CoA dehydratase subunit BcrC/BadD/HgdB